MVPSKLGIALEHATLKAIVKGILVHPYGEAKRWSVQGLGMLRLYIDDVARLHIWDRRLEYADVSKMHTHSWRLRSLVVAGQIQNMRFTPCDRDDLSRPSAIYNKQRLHCGMEGGLLDKPMVIRLGEHPIETYEEGESYQQEAEEIHISYPADGTVTIMERAWDGDNGEAFVYWPYGMAWGDAKPRVATESQVFTVTQSALERWFK